MARRFLIMKKNINEIALHHVIIFLMILISTTGLLAQRNGDDFAFQGFTQGNELGVRAIALGGAFTAYSGDINTLFYNPAGLTGIDKIQFSLGATSKNQMWRDDQVWYAGSGYRMINLYLEGLYTPPVEFNGIFSDSLGNPFGLSWNPDDIRDPVYGEDHYSKEAADHESDLTGSGISNFTAAMPFRIGGYNLVAAASYNLDYNILDYDWNGDHLDPHWGTSELIANLVEPDSILRANWSVYTRKRTGNIHSINAALSLDLIEKINLGLAVNSGFGETDDNMALDRIGYFDFVHAQDEWAFSYDTLLTETSGTSKFSYTNFKLGALVKFDRFNMGFSIKLPYTIEREWNYTTKVTSISGATSSSSSGVDKVDMPATYSYGLNFHPTKKIMLAFDYEVTPYSKADFHMATEAADTSKNLPNWKDQSTLRFGASYNVRDNFALIGGYRSWSEAFIPYGVAIRDEGPPSDSYTMGLSWEILFGRLDVAYEIRTLKYYDVYYTSRNYTLQRTNQLYMSYTIEL